MPPRYKPVYFMLYYKSLYYPSVFIERCAKTLFSYETVQFGCCQVENHDDFYKIDEGRVHVQDQRGVYIMYEESLKDFRLVPPQTCLMKNMINFI